MAEHHLHRLLGTRHPILQAGMVWTSGWRLASSAANAGALGVIGAGSLSPELLREHVTKARAATDQPLAVNLPLLYPRIQEQLEVALAAGIRIVITSAGNPKLLTPHLKAAGCTVLHVVGSPSQAAKAEAAGVDAIIAEGFEAGGHNHPGELTTLVLIPLVRRAVQLPVIAAGGIATGAQWLAAEALGADGVQVGSRFCATQEASGHPDWKQAIVAAGEDATRLAMRRLVPVRLLQNDFARQVAEAEARGATPDELRTLLGKGRARRGMLEGDLAEGELEIGQAAALIDDIPTAAEVVQRLVAEYQAARAKLVSS